MFEEFKDKHKGKTGFIMSCGPSINTLDLSLLYGKIILGTSLAYKSGVKLTYSFMGDKMIASQVYKEINELPFTWFVSRSIKNSFFKDRPNTYAFDGAFKEKFYTDLSKGKFYGGGTSTFLAMQFAYWIGLKEVYCIGLDHYNSYDTTKMHIKEVGRSNKSEEPLVLATGEDNHHFTKDFYKEGMYYYLPTTDKMEKSYILARQAFEADGRKIYNLSPATALADWIIPRKSLEEVLNELI